MADMFSSVMFIRPFDLAEFLPDVSEVKLQAMIDDVFAHVCLHVPSLPMAPLSSVQTALVTSIVRQAVIAYEGSRGGSVQSTQETSGPFSTQVTVDSRESRRGMLTWPQINALKRLESELSQVSQKPRAVEVDLLSPDWPPASQPVWW